MSCSYCGREKVKAKGFCAACYLRYLKRGSPEKIKIKTPKPCEYCGRMAVLKKGFCGACYQRQYKYGSLEKTRARTIISCSSCGTVTDNHARGLCRKCYGRWLRHGHTEQTRPDDWGAREKHPLYGAWTWIRRKDQANDLCDEWLDFWKFVQDVGSRPSHRHFLRVIDSTLDYSKDNTRWVEAPVVNSENYRDERASYMRRYRETYPDRIKNSALKKCFGITLLNYNEMLDNQKGKCDICGEEEVMKIKGNTMSLAVDHCHMTGKIRSLLCHKCNKALGGFRDSIEVLTAAIGYLKKHGS